MEKETKIRTGKIAAVLLVLALIAMALPAQIQGAPSGASNTSPVTNSTAGSSNPLNRTDPGGYIYTTNLETTQQNNGWKAYVGNVTGAFTLDDSDGDTIYDWATDASSGRVFASRYNTITWASIYCADQSVINTEDTFFGKTGTESDSVNGTFNYTGHEGFSIGTTPIPADTCRNTATYVNDNPQTVDSNALFQEILLNDSSDRLVYATTMESDAAGYKTDGSTFDFQMILPENSSASTYTSFYFWIELE